MDKIKRLNENLRDYYESEILGKSLILRDLLNIEFPLNALTNELGEYLGYDEEDFTKEELDSRVIVTDIYTDADGFIGAEIKFENRDLIENKTLAKAKRRLELIWEVNPNDIYQQLDIRDIQKAKRNRRMGGEDETGSGGFWDLAFEETLNYLFHEVGLTDLTDKEHREYTLLAEDVYNVLVDNEENYTIVRRPTLYENKTLTEALDYNEEFDEVIFELYYERIEDGTDIKELEDARKLLKTYNLNFKEEVRGVWPVFVIQDNLDKVVDFIADYMGYYGEELIEMLQDSVEPVGGGEIPEEELFILVTLKGLL